MQDNEVRHHRCEFPGCRCRCIVRHSTEDICVRCLHSGAWHRPFSERVFATESAPAPASAAPASAAPASAAPGSGSEDQSSDASAAEDVSDLCRSQQSIIDNLMMLLEVDADERSSKCCVCMERACDVVLKPCGHARFCRRCIDIGRLFVCPICRCQIRQKVAFIPL